MSSIFDNLFFGHSPPYITPESDLLSQKIDIEYDVGEVCLMIFSFNLFKRITSSMKLARCEFEWSFNTTNLEVFQLDGLQKRFCVHFPSYGGLRTANSLEQLSALGVKKIYAIGLAGGLQEFLEIGDLILLEGSVKGDGISRYYVPDEFPSVADFSLISKLKSKLDSVDKKVHIGLSFGTDALYRESFDLISYLKQLKVLSIDLETSSLFSISRSLGIKACWIGVISDLLINELHKGAAHSENVIEKLFDLTQHVIDLIKSDELS
ncbi:MAG: nucleoside phosphorylase [Spirulina sp. SIO3F2]|nr:nucleoside phosphorylase [Spirulina sp. SIO3F2]